MEPGSSLLLIFTIVGVCLAFGGAWFVVREMRSSASGERDFARLRSASMELATAEDLLRRDCYQEALTALRRSVVLPESSSPTLLRFVRDHHELVVGRFVSLVERCDLHFGLVVDLDYLLTQRHDLLALLAQVQERQTDSLLDDLVDLSRTREQDIRQELRINRTSVFFALEKLCTELEVGPKGRSAITYH